MDFSIAEYPSISKFWAIKLKVFDKEGGKFIYSINKLTYDLEINSFYFDTSKFPGIEIIDLR